MTGRRLTRRDFFKAAGAGAAGLTLLSACSATRGSGGGRPESASSSQATHASPIVSVPPFEVSGSPDGPRMNVILVIIDTLRRDHIGAYAGTNARARTPSIDALARESLRFTRAHPETEPTIPARRSIHTGRRTFPFEGWNPDSGIAAPIYGWTFIPGDQMTISEMLQAHGYRTLLITDVQHEFAPWMNFGRGFNVTQLIRGQERDSYQPFWTGSPEKMRTFLVTAPDGKPLESKGPGSGALEAELRLHLANTAMRQTEEDWFAPQVFRGGARLLEQIAQQPDPFFLVVDSFDPHEPWDPPSEYVARYSDPNYSGLEPVSPAYGPSDYLTPEQLERMRALYAAELTMTDRWLGRFLDKASDLGLLDNALLILISDHGMALGEHGFVGKPPNALWTEMTDTPFLIRHPEGKLAGQASDYFASTHDVAPTILGALGIDPPVPLDGTDLSPLFDGGQPAARPTFLTAFNNYVAVRDDRFVLITRNDRQEMRLYDYAADPEQTKDIVAEHPDVVDRLFKEAEHTAGGELPNFG